MIGGSLSLKNIKNYPNILKIVALLCCNSTTKIYQEESVMALNSVVRARVDSNLKAEVEELFKQLGLSTSQAINMFLNMVKYEKGLPFDVKIPNEKTRRVVEEARRGENLEEVSLNELKKIVGAYGKNT